MYLGFDAQPSLDLLLDAPPRPLLPSQIMSDVAKVGAAIEGALGSAQDIEGVVDHDGSIYVVQTRPQV